MATKAKADARDDTVYSNLAYIAPALVATAPIAQAILAATGAALCAGSAVYHATYTRAGQSLDASTMLTYVASLACAVASQWTLWAWAVLPVAAFGYWRYPWRVNSYIHVPLWAGATLFMIALQVGWWALLPLALALPGGIIKWKQPGPDTLAHSFWHLLSGAAGAAAMWVI